jgi:hypothetical protein
MITGYKGGMSCVPFSQKSFEARARTGKGGPESFVWLMEPYSTTQLDPLINLTGAHQYAQFGFSDDPVKNKTRQFVNCDWAAA